MKKLYASITVLLILILVCTACVTPIKYTQTWTPAPPPDDAKWSVRTDYSGLTPHSPFSSLYSRLGSGPLTELVPSDSYGLLLPYASAAVTEGGYLQKSSFGLVTTDGVIVTDLIYSSISRAYAGNWYNRTLLPSYMLSVDLPEKEPGWYPERRYAACALDGSWATSFVYRDIKYTEDLMLLVRDYDDYDVDVYDYDGKFIYNMKSLNFSTKLNSDNWSGDVVYSASEGYSRALLRDRTVAFIELATGELIYTDYVEASGFNEGLAAVKVGYGYGSGQLWGFIDSNFKLVIPPKYTEPPVFIDGHAVTMTPDGSYHIIDKRGNTLLTLSDAIISQDYGGTGFIIYDYEWNIKGLYPLDLSTFFPSEKPGMRGYIQSIGDGWYSFQVDGAYDTYLFSAEEEYFFPGVTNIGSVTGGYVVFHAYDGNMSRMGVSTLDGRAVVPPEEDMTIFAVESESGEVFFVVSTSGYFAYDFASKYRPSAYKILATDGKVMLSGSGQISYDETMGLYSVLAEDSFTYLDANFNVIVRIPMMSYTLD